MPVSIDWATKVITVPQADLTHITGTLYELDTDWFRMELKALEASETGITEIDTHDHIAGYTVAGVTYARKVEIINGYKVQFTPDAQWSVRLAGSNNNIFDVEAGILIQNQVQVIAQNSAGLIVVTMGSGVTEQDKLDIADRVLDEAMAGHTGPGTAGAVLSAAADDAATAASEATAAKVAAGAAETAAGAAETAAGAAETAAGEAEAAAVAAQATAGQAKTSADAAKVSADAAKTSADAATAEAADAADAAEFVSKIERGRWKVDKDTKQLVFYDPDTGGELARFNLLDDEGEPDAENVFERVPA